MLSSTTIKQLEEKHVCPHCHQTLSCCEAPPFHVGDGLGWGTDYFFICLNDRCKVFTSSWQKFEEQYGHVASCRYMLVPGEKTGSAMMIGSKDAFTGSIVDVQSLKEVDERYNREKEATAQLDTCVEKKDISPVLCLILDESAKLKERERACDMIKNIGDFLPFSA